MFYNQKDMIGNMLTLQSAPERIISLVPSQTELICELGAQDKLVGRTKFCIHPKNLNAIKVGGTKQINYNLIEELKPDLIICNKEENNKEIVETLKLNYPIWVSDILTLEDNYIMIQEVAKLCDKKSKGDELIQKMKKEFEVLNFKVNKTCLYLIWKNPYMAAGNQTFIHEMMVKMGLMNVLDKKNRYPELTETEIKTLKPDLVFLSSEPFPFKEKHIKELSDLLPNSKILLVNGEFFSWYGSHLLNSPQYFKQLINQIN